VHDNAMTTLPQKNAKPGCEATISEQLSVSNKLSLNSSYHEIVDFCTFYMDPTACHSKHTTQIDNLGAKSAVQELSRAHRDFHRGRVPVIHKYDQCIDNRCKLIFYITYNSHAHITFGCHHSQDIFRPGKLHSILQIKNKTGASRASTQGVVKESHKFAVVTRTFHVVNVVTLWSPPS
jgi:hypothetical protein